MSIDTKNNTPELSYEILTQYNKFIVTHVFKYDIDDLFNIFIQPENYRDLHKPHITKFKKAKGENKLNSVGSEFQYIWSGEKHCRFRVKEVIDTPNFKSILLYYQVEPKFVYNIKYNFYKNTTEPCTYFIYEIIFDTFQALSHHQINFNSEEKEAMINNYYHLLTKVVKETEQVESIVLDSDINSLWALLHDWKKFHQLAPSIADEVDYEEVCNDDVRIRLKFNCNIEHVLKLISKYKDDYSVEYILTLLNVEKTIPQDVYFNVISLNGYQCLFSFKHVFKRKIDSSFLEGLSKGKRKILEQLKANIGKFNLSDDENSTTDETIIKYI
jgi:hypothetical protein